MPDFLTGALPTIDGENATRYTVTVEVFNALISYHSAAAWNEKQSGGSSRHTGEDHRAAVRRYRSLRRALNPSDKESLTTMIESYGPVARGVLSKEQQQ